MPDRRSFLSRSAAFVAAAGLGGCTDINQTEWWPRFLGSADAVNKWVERLFAGGWSLAREYSKADITPAFRANGTTSPGTDRYNALAANGFADWRLTVNGLVERPLSLSLAQLRAMPARTQITRHDCVEGWSCIGEWTGVQLARVLAMASPRPEARYCVFYCMDPMDTGGLTQTFYYETLDLVESMHPQTLLAYAMNGENLPIPHGAPVRVRAERQLGYKQPKYVERVELVASYWLLV